LVGAASSKASGSSSSSSSSGVAPVTLQRLQLVTSILIQGHWANFYPAMLLLSLLLQRADAGVRAQFLGGPWGSYFLDVLVTVPPHRWDGEEPMAWRATDPRRSGNGIRQQVWTALQMHVPRHGWRGLPSATSCLLSLTWAHLAVAPGCDVATAAEGWAVLGTFRGALDTQQPGSLPGGCGARLMLLEASRTTQPRMPRSPAMPDLAPLNHTWHPCHQPTRSRWLALLAAALHSGRLVWGVD
jgi:hypothetical protein